MTTRYQKWAVNFRLGETADVNPALWHPEIADFLPAAADLEWQQHAVKAVTGGSTVSLANFTTVTNILIKSLEPLGGDKLSAKFRTTDGSTVDIVLRVNPQDWIKTGGDITIANNLILTAGAGTVECIVVIVGT